MIYSVTAYNHRVIRKMRIRWKVSEFFNSIPKEYRGLARPNSMPRRLGVKKPDTEVLTDPEILKRCRQYKKYRSALQKTRAWGGLDIPHVDVYFNDIDKAVEFVKNFDDERYYYRWIKISEIHPHDEESPKYDPDNYEHIAHSQVPKSDRWFGFEITSVGEVVEFWGQTYTSEFVEKEGPIYLKGMFM